ncbi:hypothetical protein ACFL67_03880 [candidate division KSB1 bacterium]
MIHRIFRFFLIINFLLPVLAISQSGTISGKVINGTTGRQVNAESIIIMSFTSGGMGGDQQFENTSEFTFEKLAASPSSPYHIQALYKGVKYSKSVIISQDGENITQDIIVYEPSSDGSAISVVIGQVYFKRLDAAKMQVWKRYQVVNNSKTTYVNENGTFRFNVDPAKIQFDFVSVNTGIIPINQQPIETDTENIYAVNYPVKPDTLLVNVAYTVGYENETYSLNENTLYDINELYILTTPTDLNVSGIELTDQGADAHQEIQFYLASEVKSGDPLSVTVSGGSAVQQPAQQDQQIGLGQNSVAEMKWLYIGVLAVILAGGSIMSRHKITPTQKKNRSAAPKWINRREKLLNEITALDDKFSQGAIQESAYKPQRDQLKKQLIDIYTKIEKLSRH